MPEWIEPGLRDKFQWPDWHEALALAAKLRRTLGRETAPLTPLRPPPPVRVERHFPEPFLHMEQMESVLAGLIEAAACILEERGEGGRVFEASFFRSDGEARRVAVETGRPTRDAGALQVAAEPRAERRLAAEQMAAAGDVEHQAVRRIEGDGRRIALAGGGQPQQQAIVGAGIGLHHVEIRNPRPGIGQRQAGAEAQPRGLAAGGAQPGSTLR